MKSKYQRKGISLEDALQLGATDAVYTFVENGGKATHIASGLLYRMASARLQLTHCFFSPSLEQALERGELGVEEDHALKLPDAALEKPILVCEWGEDHIIADGAHRLWRRWKRGDTWFKAYYVPEKAWRHFVIHGVPGTAEEWDWFTRNAKVRS